jgi:hypothetical protein
MSIHDEWTLWGNGAEPYVNGTEEEVKQAYFENEIDAAASEYLYLQDPHGNEYEHDGRKWVQV